MCVLTFPMKNPQKTKIHLECRDNEWNTDCRIDWKILLEAIMWPNLIFIRFILIEYPCWCWKVFFCCALIGDNSNDLNETSATNWVEMGKLIKLRNVEVFTRPTPRRSRAFSDSVLKAQLPSLKTEPLALVWTLSELKINYHSITSRILISRDM